MAKRQTTADQIAPAISDDVKNQMELLEKLDRGEIDVSQLESALIGERIEEKTSILNNTELDPKPDFDIEQEIAATSIDDDDDDDDEGAAVKPIAKSKKKRDRQKENILIDKMRIEQLEIEKQEVAQQMYAIKQQQLQQQQWIDQSNRQYQDSVTAAGMGRIDQLERELVDASTLYDNNKVAKINAELVRLRVEQELGKLRTSQSQSSSQPNQQYNQPQYNQQQQPSPEEVLVQRRIIEFAGKAQNKWTDLEFGPGAIPKTDDAQKLVNIINQIKAERGDWRTPSFWELVEERAREEISHKYGNAEAPKVKSPPVGMSANKGTSTSTKSNEPIDVYVANIIKQAMSGPGGLRFKTKEEMREFIRQTKDSVKKQGIIR